VPLSPEEIEQKQFLMALRGYDKEQVDGFLQQLAAEHRQLQEALEEARRHQGYTGARSGTDPFEGLAARLESILKYAAEQADQVRAAAAADVAGQLETARREVTTAGELRASAEQDAAEARRELEQARSVKARIHNEATTAIQDARRQLHELNAEIAAATQRLGRLREAEESRGAGIAQLHAAAEQEIGERREAADREMAELRAAAEREAAEVRAAAQREADEVWEAAERKAAHLRSTAAQEAAQLREAADWAYQESAKMLDAAEEQAQRARQHRTEDVEITPAAERWDGTNPASGPGAERQATPGRSWFPFTDE
jgi:DivIVA domain-containing protein